MSTKKKNTSLELLLPIVKTTKKLKNIDKLRVVLSFSNVLFPSTCNKQGILRQH